MSVATMLPSSFIQRGVKADDEKDAEHTAADSPRATSLTGRAHLGSANVVANSALIDSILAQEEQRRRALLLAAGALYYPGAPGSLGGGGAVDPQMAALLAADRQRSLLLGTTSGFVGGNSGMGADLLALDRLALASQLGARGLGVLGGQQPPGILFGVGGGGQALGSQNPYQFLAAQQRGHAGAGSAASSVLAQPIANDQLLLDAMEQGGRKGRTGTFPQKLHQMLSDLEKEEGGTGIASYLPHGRAFAIHNPSEFVKTIMPKYFRMSRFSSFQRQLNLYEFMRITDGPDKGAYFHELFHRGRPVLASQIRRNKIKGATNMNASGVKSDDRFPLGTPPGVASALLGIRSLGGGAGGGQGMMPPQKGLLPPGSK